ncbi:hypothetical protein L596_007618 [Steinernema carpocapsae]|uniref:Uncharacterized protein n=1 Tax=Steinernema carpocapsae TaxID=34508 RepID=A0A4U5PAV8_STECR|nr:hypothetical protein L596_007618 [Steinernema carpocapsae]
MAELRPEEKGADHVCLKDTGVTFRGDTSLRFDMTDIAKRFFLSESYEQTFQFAFAPEPKPKKAIVLATINFRDDSTFKVVLHKNGSVNVVVANATNAPPKSTLLLETSPTDIGTSSSPRLTLPSGRRSSSTLR